MEAIQILLPRCIPQDFPFDQYRDWFLASDSVQRQILSTALARETLASTCDLAIVVVDVPSHLAPS
jgi:hypothetical protein